jgi:hypothetical protein
VRAEGLEPPRLATLEPKSSASANSATPATRRAARWRGLYHAPHARHYKNGRFSRAETRPGEGREKARFYWPVESVRPSLPALTEPPEAPHCKPLACCSHAAASSPVRSRPALARLLAAKRRRPPPILLSCWSGRPATTAKYRGRSCGSGAVRNFQSGSSTRWTDRRLCTGMACGSPMQWTARRR